MTVNAIKNGVQGAGDVDIRELTLITAKGMQIPLKSFLVELNITEDMFSTALYGNMMLSDSLGLVEKSPIIGEEYLRVDFVTPGTSTNIYKTFRVYAMTDRILSLDDKTQGFVLHFCSPEVFTDTLRKVYKSFGGRVDQIAEKIYVDYLESARNIVVDKKSNQFADSNDSTSMIVLNETENNIKFTSPGWGPMKCLSWLASKSISKDQKASDALFYETTKAFYWGSVGSILKGYKDAKIVAGEFYYSPSNVDIRPRGSIAVNGVQYNAPDLAREYKIMTEFEVLDSFNTLKGLQDGYYANQIITVDLTHKTYKTNNFDFVEKFKDFQHLTPNAPFTKDQVRHPVANSQVYFSQQGLYNGAPNNLSERIADIKQNRMSLLAGLSNIRVQGTVPGRTDFEAGCVVYFAMPTLGPKDGTDKQESYDKYMSGMYLVTCIRHKVTLHSHRMTMEMVKDSLNTDLK